MSYPSGAAGRFVQAVSRCVASTGPLRWVIAIVGAFALAPAAAQDWIYTVRPGDNLWDLSDKYLTGGVLRTWDLQAYNAVEDPYHMLPGTRLRVPVDWLEEQPAPAEALAVAGQVMRTQSGQSEATPLTAGTELQAGDTIRTGAGASVTVKFADGSQVILRPDSELSLDTLSVYQGTGMVDTTMRLHGGRVDNEVPKREAGQSRYRIITPPAVAAVRGTGFRVGYDAADNTARSEVVSGAVGIEGAGASRDVGAGFGVVAETGKPPSPPIALLPEPSLAALPAAIEEPLMRFTWPAVADAIAYQAQVFKEQGTLLLDQRVVTPRAQWPSIANGEYAIAVRAIDRNGLEGHEARHRFQITAHPFAPRLDVPLADAVLVDGPGEFRWTRNDDGDEFKLQIARDPSFATLLIDEQVSGESYRPQSALPSGKLYWRAAAVSDRTGRFSEVRAFENVAPPESPLPHLQHYKNNRLHVLWAPAPHATSYDFELARDPNFADIVARTSSSSTQYLAPEIEAGYYYYRVRSLGGKNTASAFSPTARVKVYPTISWLPQPNPSPAP